MFRKTCFISAWTMLSLPLVAAMPKDVSPAEPTSELETVAYREFSANGEYFVGVVPAGENNSQGRMIVFDAKSLKKSWAVPGYSHAVVLSGDGQTLAVLGGTRPRINEEKKAIDSFDNVAFYAQGDFVASDQINSGTTGGKDVNDLKQSITRYGFLDDNKTLILEFADGHSLTYNALTGRALDADKSKSAKSFNTNATKIRPCGGYRHAVRLQSMVSIQLKFASRLYRQLARHRSIDHNLIFSPFSIANNLAMLRMGAAGNTEREINTIFFDNDAADSRDLKSELLVPPAQAAGVYGDRVPDLGISIRETQSGRGVIVTAVTEEMSADRAGLRKGELITAINSMPVNSVTEFWTAACVHNGQLVFELDVPKAKDSRLVSVNVSQRQSPSVDEKTATYQPAVHFANLLFTSAQTTLHEEFIKDLTSFPETFAVQADSASEAQLKLEKLQTRPTLISGNVIPPRLPKANEITLQSDVLFSQPWLFPFNSSLSSKRTFLTSSSEKEILVKTMSGIGSFDVLQSNNQLAIRIPTEGNRWSMLVVLPDAVQNLAKLESDLFSNDGEGLRNLINSNSWKSTRLNLFMPTFDLTTQLDLIESLKQMGIHDAFSREANFTRIGPSPELFVSRITHECQLTIDEQGCSSRGRTRTYLVPKSVSNELHVNRPFLFFIVENRTGFLLFAGRIAVPIQQPSNG